MSYKISAKNRRLKRTLLNILSILKFESLNVTTPHKIVLVGVVFSMISLFLNWFESFDNKIFGNGFHTLLGISGYLLFILNIKTIFIILNQKQKEIIKTFFNFNVKDGIILLFLSIFGLMFSINSIFIIKSFSFFADGIILGKGIILSIIGYIFGLIGSIWLMKVKTKTSIYIEDSENMENNFSLDHENIIPNKNNMKLPF